MIYRRTAFAGGLWLLLAALLAAALPGCKGEYEKRLADRVDELGKNSEFKKLTQAIPLNVPSATVTLYLPQGLPEGLTEVDPKADPRRSKLMLAAAPLPDNNLADMRTFEGAVEDTTHGKLHYYLHVGTLNLAPGGNDDLAIFQSSLRLAVRSMPAMGDAAVAARDGSLVACHKCRTATPMVFYYTNPDGSDAYPLPTEGLLEVWDYPIETAKKHLVLVWRVPTSQGKDFIDFDKKSDLIIRGITVSAK
jgi:hypothetical protein